MGSHVPKARLNQIAQRKLASLGIPTSLAPESETLRGELAAGVAAPKNPLSGQPLEVVKFVVEGHDRVLLVDPPAVRDLPPLLFLDLERAGQLLELLVKHLARRAAAVQQHAGKLRGLGFAVSVEPGRLVALARVELAALGAVELEADERGVRAARLLPRPPSTRAPLSLGDTAVDLQALVDRTEIELFLGQLADQHGRAAAQGRAAPPASPPAQPPQQAQAERPQPALPSGALTLSALAEKFGADASVAAGVAVGRELVVQGRRLRFSARHEQGRTFVGKLASATGTLWEERFDLDRFPGAEDFVAGFLGTAEVAGTGPSRAPPQGKVVPAVELNHGGTALLPIAGEVWVMTVVVEQDDGKEVRYAAVDIDGQPFGAPRVLAKSVFDATFAPHGAGFRLLVQIVAVADGAVTYVALDPSRKPSAQQRSAPLPGFVVNFSPEAAGY